MTPALIFMLDTNMATYIISGRSKAARQQLKDVMRDSTVALSTITQGEILFGLEHKPEAVRLRSSVEDLVGSLRILSWDSPAAQAYGKLRAWLIATGTGLSTMDMLIAAHALAIGATLVTHDKAFLRLTDRVAVADWATDL